MKTKLIALVALAAGAVAGITQDLSPGAEFEVDSGVAEGLLTAGQAKLADAAPSKKERQVKARVLIDCDLGKANDVVELAVSEAQAREKQGTLDTEKASVAYAASLPQNQPKQAD